jgi:hypothetical protein
MTPVKVNIYISNAPEDKPFADKLERWLRPMRDEVNLWFNTGPSIREPEPLPLPWRILLFWYRASQPDLKSQYAKVRAAQLDHAHVYLFLTSSNSLGNDAVIKEIETAAHRRIRIESGLKPLIYPVILTPCRWKNDSRLAACPPLGPEKSIKECASEEEGFLSVVNQLVHVIREIQRSLDEAKYRESRPEPDESRRKMWLPYLGGDDDATAFRPPQINYPSETLGWGILFALLLSIFKSLQPAQPEQSVEKYGNAEPAYVRPREYLRERPMVQPTEEIPFRPIEGNGIE